MTAIIEVPATSLLITSLLAIIIGIAILVVPRILNYLVAIYLIVLGIVGLANLYM